MLQLSEIATLSDEWQPGYLFVDEVRKFAHPMFAELLKEIRAELGDPEHEGRRHGSSGTNVRGCYGPLCKRARRLWWHSNYETKRRMAGKSYRPRPSAEQLLTEPLFELYQVHVDKVFAQAEAVRKLARDVEKALAKVRDSQGSATSAASAEVPEPVKPKVPITPTSSFMLEPVLF